MVARLMKSCNSPNKCLPSVRGSDILGNFCDIFGNNGIFCILPILTTGRHPGEFTLIKYPIEDFFPAMGYFTGAHPVYPLILKTCLAVADHVSDNTFI